jgi:hypothetical protein
MPNQVDGVLFSDRGSPRLHRADEIHALPSHELVSGEAAQDSHVLRQITAWAMQYLASSHPDLGRGGEVCPWVRPSFQAGRLYLSVLHAPDMERVEETFLGLRQTFLEMDPREGREAQLKAFLVVLPDTGGDAGRVVDALHERLKPHFVEAGLMLGEFYSTCEKRGLRNPLFYPLRSPVPLLVIRCMTAIDIAFLSESKRFIDSYFRVFPQEGIRVARRLLKEARQRLSPDHIELLREELCARGVAPEPYEHA